jgi:hypothetical protein
MKEIYDKLSSYNIFNYLFPGILLVLLSKVFVGYNFILDNDFLGAFLYYFIGMIISRVGSIIIEPLLKKVSFLKFEPYRDFVEASKKDTKIELLSEVNNTYRTLISMFVLLLLLKAYFLLDNRFHFYDGVAYFIILILLLLMFLFSYRKQTNYISKRIKANL